jgi:hypothetical protein
MAAITTIIFYRPARLLREAEGFERGGGRGLEVVVPFSFSVVNTRGNVTEEDYLQAKNNYKSISQSVPLLLFGIFLA